MDAARSVYYIRHLVITVKLVIFLEHQIGATYHRKSENNETIRSCRVIPIWHIVDCFATYPRYGERIFRR